MRDLFVPQNKLKAFFFLIFIFIIGKSQNIQLKSLIVNESLRKEILMINYYIKELRVQKIISNKPVFVRFDVGENPNGEIYNLRFLGNYYRNTSNKEELYYQVSEQIYYIFDTTAIKYLKNSINFELIRDYKNLKDYGTPKRDKGGFIEEMGEMSFEKACDKFYLDLVTAMPRIDIYYKVKFSVLRGSVIHNYDN